MGKKEKKIVRRICDKRGRIYLTPKAVAKLGSVFDISVERNKIILYPVKEE